MWYQIDFNKWGVLLLPTDLRKPKMIAFIKSLLAHIVKLHYDFLQAKALDEFVLNHNGQICYLQKALNDLFDNELRRIRIQSGNKFDLLYIFTKGEEKPLYLDEPIYIHDKSEQVVTGVDFLVFVPKTVLSTRSVELEKWINIFKKGTKEYKIIGE